MSMVVLLASNFRSWKIASAEPARNVMFFNPLISAFSLAYLIDSAAGRDQ